MKIIQGMLLPFYGTAAGAGCVFLLPAGSRRALRRALSGFAAGIMTAAAFFSLLQPALESVSSAWGMLWVHLGFLAGMLCLGAMDALLGSSGLPGQISPGTGKMVLAVTIHNIPEGTAVGIVYAGLLYGSGRITPAAALALSAGVALQNFPEGAIVSLPLRSDGMGTLRAFGWGVLSGVVEPVAAAGALFAAGLFLPVLPAMLSFAAGAMLCVAARELIPEMLGPGEEGRGAAAYALGFAVMMALDTAL